MKRVEVSDSRKLCVIDCPFIIKNISKAISLFGGYKKIDNVVRNFNSRLILNFRPENILGNGAASSRSKISAFVLKINRNSSGIDVSCIGIVEDRIYFKKLMDFQYLPMSIENNRYVMYPDNLHFTKLHDWNTIYTDKKPLYIVPSVFSRFEEPMDYGFKDDMTMLSGNDLPLSRRKCRKQDSRCVKFDTAFIPEGNSVNMESKLLSAQVKSTIVELKKAFETRPIWTKNALVAVLHKGENLIKKSLVFVAYYFINGPWKSCWVRYGYDPRTDPSSKIYQTVDYRIIARSKVMNYLRIKPRRRCISSRSRRKSKKKSISKVASRLFFNEELAYIFKPNDFPISRNNFYQLIDIHINKIQKLVHSNDGKETVCDQKDGWCIRNYQDKFRHLMQNCHKKLAETSVRSCSSSSELNEE